MSTVAQHGNFKRDTIRTALTFLIGACGGALFHVISFPLPWLLGALSASMVASLAGAPVGIPGKTRAFLMVVLGLMLGATFSPDILTRAQNWIPTLTGVAVYLLVVTVIAYFYCRTVIKMDKVTAVFSAFPGGLSQMVFVGEENGADLKSLTLSHAVRMASVLMLIPLFLTYWRGELRSVPVITGPLWSPGEYVFLLAAAALGIVLGKLIRLPAYYLTGPMLLSAGVHISGLVIGDPPGLVSICVQLAMGSALGARFSGVSISAVGKLMGQAFGLALMMMSVTVLMAAALSSWTGLPYDALVLALSPGGFAEMALAALSMNIDPSFVSTHHGMRLLLIMIIVPVVLPYLLKRIG